ncbi:hypothetical protein EJ02DRAFT_359621 [Clathrospora elynae]|uniref:Uncharacterized protein n=1 Tax=Clathrospora elynae TaxID=706981 RepID=A0A6A5S9A8_9PLEO|nr:hypothetical protein EJ02DRAFT_359621 [Clathrospora elynae]
MIQTLMATVELVDTNLNIAPGSWRDQLQTIRNATSSLDLLDTIPNEARKRWQLPLITVFQRVAFSDADNGAIQDIADWCLRQALTLLQVYPEDFDLMSLIGRNWLLRAQKALAGIARTETGSSSSEGSTFGQPNATTRTLAETELRLGLADYVQARVLLLPATDYLQRAVSAADAQGVASGHLLTMAAEAFMSLGNVTSSRVNDRYYHQAMSYLRAAAEHPNHSLPRHLEQ